MDKISVQKSIDLLKEIKGSNTFYDIHVHPYEVMFGACKYHPSAAASGLYSAGATEYLPPDLGDLQLEQPESGKGKEMDKKLRAMACLLGARRSYSHTGPMVFGDQMSLCGIDKVLMLPVMGEDEGGDGQLRAMSEMFGRSEKFLPGYCVPNNVPNDNVEQEMCRIVSEYGVKALKIHPSVTGINLGSQEGIDRVECLLSAARINQLMVVIHGGKSPDCKNSQAISYGIVNNLQNIDWSIISEPVIIAHGGCFGHSVDEATETVIPAMVRLFERYENLSFDTSGISFDHLCALLQCFEPARILFGSDALYEKQWASVLRLWHALKKTTTSPEESLLRIISKNPGNLFGTSDVGR